MAFLWNDQRVTYRVRDHDIAGFTVPQYSFWIRKSRSKGNVAGFVVEIRFDGRYTPFVMEVFAIGYDQRDLLFALAPVRYEL